MQYLVLGVCLQPAPGRRRSPRRPKNAISRSSARSLRRASAAPVKPSIPRSYALVVGIGKYQKLPESGQLQFPERDAESIYSVLISPEGGNFRAENVHRLIGSRATLANLRKRDRRMAAELSPRMTIAS